MRETKLAILKNLTILLVEDDKILSQNLEKTLGLFFKNVYIASNGADGLKIFQNETIDMIITDYVMPIMDGYELCKEIRQINDKIPMVILSNYQDGEKLLNVIPLNLTKYLIKPIEYSNLTDVLILMIEKMEKENIILEKLTPTISFNKLSKILQSKDGDILLTQNEIVLLELFLKHHNQLVSNDMIDREFYKTKQLTNSAIVNIIYRLRKKLDKTSIINVQSLGYIFRKTDMEE